ncbi:hypothetical protein HYX02_04305 [Candidatus Woesearchaeota archaeon]|nr:hypothetical protein [Candidatus Woesearchaeota archaeon]
MKTNRKIITNKKSQTTIFLIVGLVILIGGAIFFYSTQKLPKPYEPEIKIVQEQVPVEFDPIREYVSACAYSVGVEGLKIIGKQGGYISFADRTLNKERFAISNNPTESDAVVFASDSDLRVPYWWYLKSANNCKGNCQFASKKPELRNTENSIEKQLERYIDLKFRECLSNFEPFAEQGYKIIEESKLKSDVTIGTEEVIVIIEYPLDIEKQDAKTRISQFFVSIPVNLDKIYDLATKITNLEIKHRYLEKHMLNMLVSFSGVDKEKLPPMADMQFNFGSSISWQKSDIRNKITGLLASYIPLFQIDGTYNYERNLFGSELKQRLYDSTIIPIANSSFRNLAASFTYLDFWRTYFDLNCRGEQCVPSSANSIISFFGIQEYRFAYDLSFPVMVEIEEPFALDGQGYTFNFFLEGNIRNNKPMPSGFSPLERTDLSEKSLLCDTRTSGNVTVNVANAASKKPVGDAQILYTIVDESCFIGSTDNNGVLKQAFPVGIGGVVNVVKDGYIGKVAEFDPKVNTDASLKVGLQPAYTKKLIVRKKNVVKTQNGWQFVDAPLNLNDKETVAVTLRRISDEGELDFSSVANYEGQQKEPSDIEIAPGKYTAEISLLLNDKIAIPEKQKCVRVGIFNLECYTTPQVDFAEASTPGQEIFPEGGLNLNITISANELEKYGAIVLYAVAIDFASVPEQSREIEDTEQIGKIDEYSNTYQLALQPRFE